MDQKVDTRDRILNAAVERMKHYGYGKTTMAEIAGDCAMSPGNIYRFFESKLDIAEAMARQHALEQNARLSAIARRRATPADKRLRDMMLARLRENFVMLDQNAKYLEIADVLRKERPLYHNEQLALQRVFMGEVLRDGIDAGLFRPMDVEFTAEMIQAATHKFSYPHLFSRLTLPKLEREFEGVMTLLLNGLYAAQRAPGGAANEQ
jgi:AcrR family transcriptional regulator